MAPMGALLNQGILNDLEHPTEFMKQPDIPQQRFQGLHHMFVASALAVKMAHEIDPEYKVGNMMIYSASCPLTCSPDDVLACQKYNRLYNYYCTDVQAKGEYPSYADSLLKELNVTVKKEPGDDDILKNGTVDFISFSYYMSSCQTADTTKESGEGNILGGVPNPYLEASDWGCIDLVSASTGEYAKRYGMIYVRRYDDGTGDFARLKKKSFYWYQRVIQSNGEEL